MDRRLKSAAIYQGLFLMAFGLFAHERVKPSLVLAPSKKPEAEALLTEEPPSRAVELLFQELSADPIFKAHVDGLGLKLNENRITILLQSEELYREDSQAIEEPWHPILDQIANSLFSKLDPNTHARFSGKFRIRVQGFKEEPKEGEGSSAFKQESAFTLAVGRAEWLIHYYETRFQTRSKATFWVGAGVAPTSKRIELQVELK